MSDLPASTPTPRRPPLTIILPVYGAADVLDGCLRSVLRHTDLTFDALLLVLDGPQDAAVESAIAQVPQAQVLRLPQRQGFVGAVNAGMAACHTDVVLLNSDTVVTAGWLDQLAATGGSRPQVATVTPLSNNGSLCSVPRIFVENFLPVGMDADGMAEVVRQASVDQRPELPTGVGFCLWIARAALNALGLFDQQHFGLGYGEENEFCARATAQGWCHLACDRTFIQHLGHRSFKAERKALQRAGWRTLRRLHPGFAAQVAAFTAADPLAPVRQRIVEALRAQAGNGVLDALTARTVTRPAAGPQRVVHVVHGWPPLAVAGTELYAHGLVHAQRRHREVAVYARLDDPARDSLEPVEWMDQGVRVRLRNNTYLQRNPLSRNGLWSGAQQRDFAGFLRETGAQLVHVHHLAGHVFGLVEAARQLGLPVVLQVQDWWGLCARVNLLDASGQRCAGPQPRRCAQCQVLTRLPPAALSNRLMHALRRAAVRHTFSLAQAYVMGSRAIHDDYAAAGLFAAGVPAHVLDYGVSLPQTPIQRAPARLPLRFGFIGSAQPHKGLQVARAAFADIDPAQAVLQVWGSAGQPFAEADKDRIFAGMDVLLMPSVGLESFGLVAREALARGVPVIASADGALRDLPARHFRNGDVAALRRQIEALIADPDDRDRWAAALPPVKSIATHANEIEAIYQAVWEAAR